jgi:two-component system response regulator RegA
VTTARAQTLLLVDDDPIMRRTLRRELERAGYAVHPAAGYEEALQATRGARFDVALVDVQMPDGSGLELLQKMRARGDETPVVLMTAYGSIPTAVEGMRLGAVEYLTKPVSPEQIKSAIGRPLAPISQAREPSTLARAEWEHLQRALGESNGNVSEAARRLGIPRRTLQRKLRKLPPTE